MADQKISELTNITGANLANADEFVVVDSSADQTKAITFGELKEAFDTGTGFVRITGDTMTGDLSFGDNDKAIFGAGSDLQIYHNGSNSYIKDAGTGNLSVIANVFRVYNAAGNELSANFVQNGEVTLYHDGAQKLSTTSTGVDILGTLTSDGLTVDGDGLFQGNSGMASGSGTPVTLQIKDVSSGGSWVAGDVHAALDFFSSDGSGVGNGVRGRLGIAQETAVGGSSSINIQVVPTTAGTLQTALKVANNGDISFYDSQGSSQSFFWDSSAESLGIGTSSPAGKLEVLGSASSVATSGTVIIRQTGDGAADGLAITSSNAISHRIWKSAGGALNIGPSTSPSAFVQDSSGNVGIGTSSPIGKLDVSDGSNPLSIDSGTYNEIQSYNRPLLLNRQGNNVGIGTNSPSRKLSIYDATAPTFNLQNSTSGTGSTDGFMMFTVGADATLVNYEAGNLVFSTSGAEAMRIDSSGNVGIGTSSPDAEITVAGDAHLKATSGYSSLYFNGVTTASARYAAIKKNFDSPFDLSINASNSSSGAPLIFNSSSTLEAMRIDSSGRVGIGTNSPTEELEVHSTGDATVLVKTSGTGDADATLQLDSAASGESMVEFMHDGVSGAGIQWFTDGGPDLNIFTSAGTNGVIDFQPNNSLAMRIDSSGNMLLGTTTVGYTNEAIVLRERGEAYITSDGRAPLLVNRLTSDGVLVSLRKNGTTVGSIGAKSGDVYIGTGDTALAFYDASSYILPYNTNTSGYNDNSISLGNANYRFDDIYATNGTIQTSDRNEKQDIEALSDAETRVAQACKGLLRKFRWVDAVAEKGDDARIHFGIIAQDLQDAFTAEGLDAGRYAMFISSTWWETQTEVPAVEAVAEVLDDEGNVVTEAVEAKEAYTRTDTYETQEEAPEGATERTRLGVRYPELLSFIIAAI